VCNTTKQKIAATLREMMTKKSFDKITVKNLMDASDMKRQSFYYHFQDTRDVLMWICRNELIYPLAESRLEFSEWMLYGLTLLDRDRLFYRKVIFAAQADFLRQLGEQAVFPRVRALLYGDSVGKLSEEQTFAVEFMGNAVMGYFMRFADSHRALDLTDCRGKLRFLVNEIRKNGK
jgi:AcrR family transcriptional regulator